MSGDLSRIKSLSFLVSANARNYGSTDTEIKLAKEILQSIKIIDAGDNWVFSAGLTVSRELKVPKTNFAFYQTRPSNSENINPAIKNRNAATQILDFFMNYEGLSHSKMQTLAKRRNLSSPGINFSLSIILIGIVSITLPPYAGLAGLILLAVYQTNAYFQNGIARFVLIAGIIISLVAFRLINSLPSSPEFLFVAFSFLICEVFIFSEFKYSKFLATWGIFLTYVVTFLFLLTKINTSDLTNYLLFIVCSAACISMSLRVKGAIRLVFFFAGMVILTVSIIFWIIQKPTVLLLTPIFIISTFTMLNFGSAKNPARLVFPVMILFL